jgi:hypothetical protein
VPWYVHETKDGYHLIHPDSKIYYKYCESTGPVPWNQQQSIVGGLLRLAQCHRLLNDGNTNISFYEKITADTAHWFFATAKLVNSRGKVCCDWAYTAEINPAFSPEATTESDYDMFVFRAYQANLGPTRQQMQRLINTARFAMYLGTNRFAGQVNGTSNQRRHDRQFLEFEWIEMSVLDKEFYNMTAGAVLTSHEYYDNIAVEATVLSAKHYWATTKSAPPGTIEDASGVPPMPQRNSTIITRHWRLGLGIILLCWFGIKLLLTFLRRSKIKNQNS